MQILNKLPDERLIPTAVCIGKFDGLHLGHRLLIDTVNSCDEPSLMLTFCFENNKGIYSGKEKLKLAEKSGIDIYVEIPVTKEFFAMTPENFTGDILAGVLSAKHVAVGEDFRFGKDRSGDITTLDELSDRYGYILHAHKKLTDDSGEVISSTRIRKCIEDADLETAYRLLGRPYSITGRVVSGNHIGRTINHKTANIIPERDKLIPPNGVYAVRVIIEDDNNNNNILFGVGNLGIKPTIGDDYPIGLEVNLFDFDGDIYDRIIEVELIAFIREEIKFDSLEKLKGQIEIDTKKAKEIIADKSLFIYR